MPSRNWAVLHYQNATVCKNLAVWARPLLFTGGGRAGWSAGSKDTGAAQDAHTRSPIPGVAMLRTQKTAHSGGCFRL